MPHKVIQYLPNYFTPYFKHVHSSHGHGLIRSAAHNNSVKPLCQRKSGLKPGFHMIFRIVPIAPVVSKYFETMQTTGAIGSFHMIVSIASKARHAWSSAMSLGQTIEFLRVFCIQAT